MGTPTPKLRYTATVKQRATFTYNVEVEANDMEEAEGLALDAASAPSSVGELEVKNDYWVDDIDLQKPDPTPTWTDRADRDQRAAKFRIIARANGYDVVPDTSPWFGGPGIVHLSSFHDVTNKSDEVYVSWEWCCWNFGLVPDMPQPADEEAVDIAPLSDPPLAAPSARAFRVRRKVDAYVVYETEVRARTAGNAAYLAHLNADLLCWANKGAVEMGSSRFIAVDDEGSDIVDTEVCDG